MQPTDVTPSAADAAPSAEEPAAEENTTTSALLQALVDSNVICSSSLPYLPKWEDTEAFALNYHDNLVEFCGRPDALEEILAFDVNSIRVPAYRFEYEAEGFHEWQAPRISAYLDALSGYLAADKERREYTIDTPYTYPLTPAMTEEWWKLTNAAQKHEVCQVPQDMVENMTTRALLQTLLDYPMFHTHHAFDTLELAFLGMANSCNSLPEFCGRPDALEELLAYEADEEITLQRLRLDELKLAYPMYILGATAPWPEGPFVYPPISDGEVAD